MTILRWSNVLAAGLALFVAAVAAGGAENTIAVHKRSRTEEARAWVVRECASERRPARAGEPEPQPAAVARGRKPDHQTPAH